MLIPGQCQCGNISFSLDWPSDPGEIQARACVCSFCQAHGGVWVSSPSAGLRVEIRNPLLIDRYSFATQTAEFFICQQCGDVPLVSSGIDGQRFAAVNANALRGLSSGVACASPVDFSGESLDERIARRRRCWIPEVSITGDVG